VQKDIARYSGIDAYVVRCSRTDGFIIPMIASPFNETLNGITTWTLADANEHRLEPDAPE
jgi:hypothetical protein